MHVELLHANNSWQEVIVEAKTSYRGAKRLPQLETAH